MARAPIKTSIAKIKILLAYFFTKFPPRKFYFDQMPTTKIIHLDTIKNRGNYELRE